MSVGKTSGLPDVYRPEAGLTVQKEMNCDVKPVSFAPAYLWLIPLMTEIAREYGYALAVHGSVNRDLDLIAVPWVEEAKSAIELVEALRQCISGNIRAFVKGADGNDIRVNPENKPHGRVSWAIQMQYPHLYIDLSVMPVQKGK